MGTANVFDELLDFAMLGIDKCPLKYARQESRLPIFSIFDRVTIGAHRYEARQVLILHPQSVEHPSTDTGTRLHGIPTIHQHQRRFVVWNLRIHRPDDRDVVNVFGCLRE